MRSKRVSTSAKSPTRIFSPFGSARLDPGNLRRCLPRLDRPKLDLAIALQRADGDVSRRRADALGDVRDAEVELSLDGLRHEDGNLLVSDADQFDLLDAGVEQVVSDAQRIVFEVFPVKGPVMATFTTGS